MVNHLTRVSIQGRYMFELENFTTSNNIYIIILHFERWQHPIGLYVFIMLCVLLGDSKSNTIVPKK